jgi:hypothetical protein
MGCETFNAKPLKIEVSNDPKFTPREMKASVTLEEAIDNMNSFMSDKRPKEDSAQAPCKHLKEYHYRGSVTKSKYCPECGERLIHD